MQYDMGYWLQSDLYLVFDPEAQIECQHVPVSTEGDTDNKVQLIDIICRHYLREQVHKLNE